MRRRFFAVGAAVVTMAAGLTLAGALTRTADAATAPGSVNLTDHAIFNNPYTAARTAIQDYVISLIDGTDAGSTIRLSTYIYASATYRDALLAAHDRGVNVQIVADSYNNPASKTTWHQLQDALGTNKSAASYAITCAVDNGCVGTGIDHDKFFLFSNTWGKTKVFVQTSANMIDHTDTGNSGLTAWNNAVVFFDEPTVYDAYVTRFTAMRDQNRATAYTSVTGTNAKVYFFPRAGGATTENNTVLGVLDNVNCGGTNTTGGWGDNHLTSIHVAMYLFTDTAIAQKLWALDNAGCVVHVIRTNVGTDDDAAIAILNNCTAHNGVTIDSVHFRDSDNDETSPEKIGFIHSKYLVIDGYYDGSPNQRLVWTGSYNYTAGALRSNDEALLKISHHDDIFNAFQSNFATLNTYSYATVQAGSC